MSSSCAALGGCNLRISVLDSSAPLSRTPPLQPPINLPKQPSHWPKYLGETSSKWRGFFPTAPCGRAGQTASRPGTCAPRRSAPARSASRRSSPRTWLHRCRHTVILQSAAALSPFLLEHLLQSKGGAADRQRRQWGGACPRATPPSCRSATCIRVNSQLHWGFCPCGAALKR